MRSRILRAMVGVGLMVAALSGARLVADTHASPDTEAQRHLRAARGALGGDERIATVKRLVLRGSLRTLDGGSGRQQDARPFEIRVIRPDHYLRLASNPMIRMRYGFTEDHVIFEWKPLSPQTRMSMQVPEDALQRQHADCARLMLGLLAETQTAIRLEADPGSTATSVQLTGPENFAATLDLDPVSHVPLRVRYQSERSFPQAQPAQSGAMRGVVPPPERTEIVLAFDERQTTDGVSVAHHITESARGFVFQEIRFDSVLVNPALTAKDFEVQESAPPQQ
jgi:hypothetical protein